MPEGGSVVIPNDKSNGARALQISGITPALGPGPRAETMAATGDGP